MLTPGARLGPYEVISPLGAGGMGEVYRARDTRLGRDVAIKVLPESLSADPAALARFQREASAVATLSHPNILAIHDVGDEHGTVYAVMELLEGETLRSRLESGAIPGRKASEYALQIAQGLAAAHEKGIVHRDLKPENVFLLRSGRVKILDFGLARTLSMNASTDTRSPTVAGGTEPGIILGTVGYMSPEQVRGQPADARSDIFSFGAVFFEMLSGRRAFQGNSAVETMNAILTKDPEPAPDRSTASLSPALERIVHHCLEKNPEERFRSAHDLAFALETASSSSSPAAAPLPGKGSRRRPILWIGALAAAAGMGWLGSTALRTPPKAPLALTGVARFSHDPGISEWPTWSPDGSLLAFASNRSGNFEIYVRRVDGGQEINVTDDPGEDFQPSFSSDGRSIAFVSTRSSRTGMIHVGAAFGFQFRTMGGDLWVAPALGGKARKLAPDGNAPAWDPPGKRIAYVSGPEYHRSILDIAAEGGTPRTILPSSASRYEITRLHYSPSGKWISFETAPDGEVFLVPAGGGTPRPLLPRAASHAWDAKSHRVFYLNQEPSGGTRLQAVAIDEANGTAARKPEPVAIMTGILRDIAIHAAGRQIAMAELEGSLNLTRLPMKPDGSGPSGPEEPLSTGHVLDRYPTVSPDGKKIAYGSDRLGSEDLWIYDRESRHSERIDLPGKDFGVNEPFFSPDGRWIVVTRLLDLHGKGSLWKVAPDGSQSEELKTIEGLFSSSGPISPDGREMIYLDRSSGLDQIFAFRFADRRSRQVTRTPMDKFDGSWSPDGKWIVFEENDGEKYRLIRMPSEGGEEKLLLSSDERLRHAFVSPDGRWVYVQPSHRNVGRVPAEGGLLEQVTRFPESGLFIEEPTMAPDGSCLVYSRSNGGSSLWLLTLDAGKTP
jgi:serine/threonine protein kinase